MIVVGETGVGKSSFCNTLVGKYHGAKLFPVGTKRVAVTNKTTIVDECFRGDQDRPIRVIDTPGFNDSGDTLSELQKDTDITTELITKLGDVNSVHMFVLCINATGPHIPPSLIKMIKIFLSMYGFRVENFDKKSDPEEFWRRLVVNFTRYSFSEAEVTKRKETKETSDDLELCVLERLKKHFSLANHGLDDIKYFYIDSLYSKENAKELEMFNNETERLYEVLRTNSPARSFAHQKDFMRLRIYRDCNSNHDNSENDKSQSGL